MSHNEEIYWIGNDYDKNNSNKKELKKYFIKFKEYDNIEKFFEDLKKTKPRYSFKLIYCVINVALFDKFTILYEEFIKNKCILIYSIVFSENIYEDIHKKNINDPFYNPGGISDDIQIIENYIKNVQNRNYYPNIDTYNTFNYKNLFEHHKNKFGEMIFQFIENEKEIIVPLMWNEVINMKIDGKQVANLQRYIIQTHIDEKNYIYPSRDKIIKINDTILAKFFLYLYTTENGEKSFYSNMNRILSHEDGLGIYSDYINILFYSLKNKTFKIYKEKELYRGTKISKKNYENLYKLFQEKKGKNILFYTKSFLSFTKKESVLNNFLLPSDNPALLSCKFHLRKSEKINNNWNAAFNLDVNGNSYFEFKEEEVLFLPMSCFLVEKIKEIDKYNVEIYLKYLDEYTDILDQKLSRIKQNIKDKQDFETAFLTNYGKDLQNLYSNIIDNYKKYFLDNYSIQLQTEKPDKNKSYISDQSFSISVGFDTEAEVKSLLYKLENEKELPIVNKAIYNVTESDIDENGEVNILGENKLGDDFVKLNKDKVKLKINDETIDLCYKYKLNKGINEINFIFNNNNKITDFSYLFYKVTALTNIIGLNAWDMSQAINLKNAFAECINLSDISPLSHWDVSNVRNFSSLFSNCTSLSNLTALKNWKVNNGIFFSYIFYNCNNLVSLKGLDNWDISNSKFFNCSFAYCSKLKDITALENWNFSKTDFLSYFFFECHELSDIKPLEKWNVSNVKFFDYIFYGCYKLSDITPIKKWDVSNGNNLSYAFCKCYELKDLSALSEWNIKSDCYVKDIFKGCTTLEKTRPIWYYKTILI